MPRRADVSWFLAIARKDERPGATVLAVSGRLGKAVAHQLGDAIRSAIEAGNTHIVLDLSGVDYINSAGVQVVGEAAARLRELDGSLTLTGLRDAVKLALDLAGPIPHATVAGA
jgi:anti-sigma B factor antagonist